MTRLSEEDQICMRPLDHFIGSGGGSAGAPDVVELSSGSLVAALSGARH
jgi:hypothetical protein